MQVVYQNQFISDQHALLKITNRGFLYGDGFFETLLYANNQIPYLELHLQRIFRAFSAFELTHAPFFDLTYLTDTIHELCHKNKLPSARIKIMFWRSEGGLYAPENNAVEFMITSAPLQLIPEVKNNTLIYPENINVYSSTSEYKPLSASNYVSAGLFKRKNAVDEVIILGQNNITSEALASNLFWIKDDTIFTPSLTTGCVNGVMRSVILSTEETIYEVGHSQHELLSADAVFTSNALGIQHLIKINDTNYKKSEFAQHLIETLVRKYI